MKVIEKFIKGIAIGLSMLVPGVSGGTMALILGIYDEIIRSISSFFDDVKKNITFLGILGFGGIIGVGAFAYIIGYALEKFEYPTMFLFLGIVIGGLPVLFKEAKKGEKSKWDIPLLIIGFLLVLSMGFGKGTLLNLAGATGFASYLVLFLAGIIIAVALILPGISTSFLLLALGIFDITIEAIKTVNLPFLVPIGLGALFGIIATTRILENLMNKKPRGTYLMIIGFVLGSVVTVIPGLDFAMVDGMIQSTILIPGWLDATLAVVCFVIGYLVIRYISKKYID